MAGLVGAIVAGLESKADVRVGDINTLWLELFGGRNAKSGVAVNVDTALQVSTVFACLRVLSQGIGQLPFHVFKDQEKQVDHPVYKLLHRRPNDWQTPFEWKEGMILHSAATGNAYSFINRVNGKPVELLPLVSNRVTVEQRDNGELTYSLSLPSGGQRIFPRSDIFHLRGPSWNGFLGLDAVRQARESIGLAIATEETHSRFHSNGARPGGVLVSKGTLTTEQIKDLREEWQKVQGGVENAMKTAVLSGDLEWKPMAMSGVDSQHLETRRFQIEEICRGFGVFPLMVMQADKTATFASSEAFFLAHVIHSLDPWATRFEQAANRDLLTESETDQGFFAELNRNALLRAASKDRSEIYAKALGSGGSPAWMTQDEVREKEGLPLLGGDAAKLPTPTNPAPAGTDDDATDDDTSAPGNGDNDDEI